MNLFGSKNKTAQPQDEVEDIGAVDEIENAGAPLSAPVKGADESKKGSTRFLLFLLTLIVAGGGGAYYYVGGMSADSVPVLPPEAVVAAPDVPSAEPTSISEAPAVQATVDPATPVTTEGVPVAPAPEGAAPAEAGAVPSATETTVAPVQSDAPLESPSVQSIAETSAAVSGATPVDAIDEMPPSDLPLPREEPLNTVSDTPSSAASANAETPTTAPAVTDAEKAIVENAEVIDKVSHPTEAFNGTTEGKLTASPQEQTQIQAQPAIIRPVPETYIIVKKDHDASDVDSRIAAGRVALSQGRSAAALEIFNGLFVDYPLDKRVLMGRALAYQHSGQADTAMAAYEDVLVKDPKNLEALTNMLGLLKAQDPSLAAQKLSELREIYPYNADIAAQLGISFGAKGDYVQGLKYLDIADSLSPGRLDILYNRAVIYDRAGRASEASNLYREVLSRASGQESVTLPLEAIRNRLSVLR